MKVGAVILAAGSGTRLNDGNPSEKPKVLYEILGKPMVSYTLKLLNQLQIEEKVMVVGYQAEMVMRVFEGQVKFATQEERSGTAHAAKVGEESLDPSVTHMLIIQGDDSAFYKSETIKNFLNEAKDYKVGFTTVNLENPGQYGRIVRNNNNEVEKIVEKESLTQEQQQLNEVNAATYFVERSWFNKIYPEFAPSRVGKGELILTDLIELTRAKGEKVLGFNVPTEDWVGVNTKEELDRANQLMKERLNG